MYIGVILRDIWDFIRINGEEHGNYCNGLLIGVYNG